MFERRKLQCPRENRFHHGGTEGTEFLGLKTVALDTFNLQYFDLFELRALRASVVNPKVEMVEELEHEYSALRDKVHDLQEYL